MSAKSRVLRRLLTFSSHFFFGYPVVQYSFADDTAGTIDTLALVWDAENNEYVSVPLTITLGKGTFDIQLVLSITRGRGTHAEVSSELIIVEGFKMGRASRRQWDFLKHPIMADVVRRLVNEGFLNRTINQVLNDRWRNTVFRVKVQEG